MNSTTAGNDTWAEGPSPGAPPILLAITVLYALIFLLGIVGNVGTCVVIARNKHMHTATNYYLFSLAVSDLLLLVSSMPQEMYYMWFKTAYTDSDALCVLQGFAAETSANASVLTITAFTVERYVAICHPFQSHTMSKLSRAVKFIVAIWMVAFFLAVAPALQFHTVKRDRSEVVCAFKESALQHVFGVSTCVFFLLPLTVISVLYVLIAVRLRRSRDIAACGKTPSVSGDQRSDSQRGGRKSSASQAYVIRMLVAVVVAFFICWAPFHAQRLMAVYAISILKTRSLDQVFTTLNNVSGILYYLSTTINPVLYNIMSHKFREAFKSTLAQCCGRKKYSPRKRAYSVLSKCNNNHQHQLQLHHKQLCRAQPDWRRQPPPPPPPHEDGAQPLVRKAPRRPSSAELSTRHNLNHSYPQYNPRSRMSSDSSQLTLTTSVGRLSLAKGGGDPPPPPPPPRERTGFSLLRTHPSICALARMLRGSGGLAAPTPQLASHPSVDSGRSTTNTISNSSLQDLDEAEFVGTDLVSYMGELNELVVMH